MIIRFVLKVCPFCTCGQEAPLDIAAASEGVFVGVGDLVSPRNAQAGHLPVHLKRKLEIDFGLARICCVFENLAIHYFKLTALNSAIKFFE